MPKFKKLLNLSNYEIRKDRFSTGRQKKLYDTELSGQKRKNRKKISLCF